MQQEYVQTCYNCYHGTHKCSGMMNDRSQRGKRIECLCKRCNDS